MDLKIKTATRTFHYCVRAIIRQDAKILLLRVDDAAYYHLPGGHVTLGETSAQALQREVQEEVGFAVTLERLVVVQEQFYQKKGTNQQALILYYLAVPQKPVSTQNSVRLEQGKTRLIKNELRWVTLSELKDLDLRPASLKARILNQQLSVLQHVID